MSRSDIGLVGDIGATNARFAIVTADGTIAGSRIYACEEYPTIAHAIDAYLADESPREKPVDAVLAVASPITGDRITLTNNPWSFSIEDLRRHFAFRHLYVINDFTANALAVPHLSETDRVQVGPGAPVAGAPIGVIGPGSGLGVSALVYHKDEWIPVPGEGGHVTMSPGDERESAVLDLMRRRFDHVSAERVLSGPGLVNLYNAICELARTPAASLTPAQITNPTIQNEIPHCREAVEMFCAMLGTVAGNLALTLGAQGGIYIAGGIVPKLGPMFAESAFRTRFEAKGRLRHYVATIPTYVITRPIPAFLGAAKFLESRRKAR